MTNIKNTFYRQPTFAIRDFRFRVLDWCLQDKIHLAKTTRRERMSTTCLTRDDTRILLNLWFFFVCTIYICFRPTQVPPKHWNSFGSFLVIIWDIHHYDYTSDFWLLHSSDANEPLNPRGLIPLPCQKTRTKRRTYCVYAVSDTWWSFRSTVILFLSLFESGISTI